jgi:hypothetical protein
MSLEQELRGTSDSLLRALDRMNDMESEKRLLPTGSSRFVELAQEIERLAVDLLKQTQEQTSLAETTVARAVTGAGPGRPIESIPAAPRDLSAILSDWRDAERALAMSDPASSDAAIAAANVRRLREEYRLAHEHVAARRDRDQG